MSKRNYRIILFVIMVISSIFYLIWYWHDGIILTEDAESYISMSNIREPGYCSFLWILRTIFGKGLYLHAAVIMQCLAAGLACVCLTDFMKKTFSLKWNWILCMLAVQYGLTLLNRFVAQRRYSYFNSIETEGLTYSIWIFFFLGVAKVLYEKKKTAIIESLCWAVLLVSIRKQMMIAFVILFFCLLYIWLKEKPIWKNILLSAAIILTGLLANSLIEYSYNYALRGEFSTHAGDSSFILGTEIYLADEEMADKIADQRERQIFLEIIRRAEEKEYHVSYAEAGWSGLENHYSNSYDRIKFDIINVVVRENQEQVGIAQQDQDEDYNAIAGSLMKQLLVPCLPDMVRLFCANVIHGLITTVLKVHPILNKVAFILYVGYIGLFGWLLGRHLREGDTMVSLPFALLVLFAIICNVGLTSATIYCQMRYMLYNTGLFYQAGLLMMYDVNNIYRKREHHKSKARD